MRRKSRLQLIGELQEEEKEKLGEKWEREDTRGQSASLLMIQNAAT